jgi:hypothetical protein
VPFDFALPECVTVWDTRANLMDSGLSAHTGCAATTPAT